MTSKTNSNASTNMDRKVSFEHEDWGTYTLYVVYATPEGTWRGEDWEWIRIAPSFEPIRKLFSSLDEQTYEKAIKGHTMPAIRSLGRPPDGCLKKCPDSIQPCRYRQGCPEWDENQCLGYLDNPPPCYSVDGEELLKDDPMIEWGPRYQYMIDKIFQLWRNNFYITVVQEHNG